MKIKITPENDMEKQKIKEVVHTGVQDFFIIGNKKDDENNVEDFQDWKGSYRFLIGGLHYFLGQITEEKNAKDLAKTTGEMDIQPKMSTKQPQMFKKGDVNNLKIINTEEIPANNGNAFKLDEFVPQNTTEIQESKAEDDNN